MRCDSLDWPKLYDNIGIRLGAEYAKRYIYIVQAICVINYLSSSPTERPII
jgi:hypothetical protein